jgi:hypothetical protein
MLLKRHYCRKITSDQVRLTICLTLCLLTVPIASAQSLIPVQTPRLPARTDIAGGAPNPASQSQNPQAQYPQGQNPQGQNPQGQYPQGQYPQQGSQPVYANRQQPGGYPQDQLPPQAMIAPTKAPDGACRATSSANNQTVVLVSGPQALPRLHVPLGEFRAQDIVHSPDGKWAVVFLKLRGVAQYAVMSFDLERCATEKTLDLASAGTDARFEGDEAILQIGKAEQRMPLRDRRIR